MTTERYRFSLSDTYQKIQWSTPIGCVEFKTGDETMTFPFYYCLFVVIDGIVNERLIDLDNEEGRRRLIKKVNQLIKSSLINKKRDPLMSNTER